MLRIGGRKGGEVRTADLEGDRTSSGRPRRKKKKKSKGERAYGMNLEVIFLG